MSDVDLAQQLYSKALKHPVSEWRREQPRRYIRETIVMRREGESTDIHGRTIDVGPDSLGVSCFERLDPGDRLQVCLELQSLRWSLFEVQHCSTSITGFKLGLKIIKTD